MVFWGRSVIADATRYEALVNHIAIQQAAHRQGRATGGYEGLPLPGGRPPCRQRLLAKLNVGNEGPG